MKRVNYPWVIGGIVVGLILIWLLATASAVPAPKVFVCKYVGKPGVDERLQTGNNPISVSANATGGATVGSYFNDAQGRSLVIAIDTGQDEPECPVPQNPPVDVCDNIVGLQTTVPAGMEVHEAICEAPKTEEPPVDQTPPSTTPSNTVEQFQGK